MIVNTDAGAKQESLQRSGFNNFLVMGLPILDKSPTNVGKENPSPNSTMLSTWNSIIQQDAAMFEAQHPESRVLYFDIYDFLDGIWSNAAAYGLKNTTGYCEAYDQGDVQWNYKKYGCEPIQDYFWYSKYQLALWEGVKRLLTPKSDTGHITYPVHKYLGQELQRFLSRESTRG
ncbi:hypothetical protein KEM55_002410 [Ascosphaera atra]|nr:hypothetical protein KEM55_002410 [Ascosphaera atra]